MNCGLMFIRSIRKGQHMKYSIFLISIFLISFAHADVYKYTNKQGKTAYSDTPIAGAEKIVVPPIMTYEAPAIPAKKTIVEQKKNGLVEENIPYSYLNVISPVEQGTIRSNQGIVNVTYEIQPALQKGDSIELLVDGVAREGFNIQGIERGAHVVQVQVVAENGDIKISSSSVTFYLQRSSKPKSL